uniref:Uncharacterized protein n=1 Tax=Globodera pallida TaxID=36090 RepID=A0A183BP23_GLOPA
MLVLNPLSFCSHFSPIVYPLTTPLHQYFRRKINCIVELGRIIEQGVHQRENLPLPFRRQQLYSLHENTRYYYESPFYTRAPTCSPAWDYSSNSNYYTYLLDSVRPVWRCWPYPQKSSYYEYRTYWPWRESIRSHFW